MSLPARKTICKKCCLKTINLSLEALISTSQRHADYVCTDFKVASCVSVMSQGKMPNICWFQHLKCEDSLLLLIFFHCN